MKCPEGLNDNQNRNLKLQASKYVFMDGDLYWKNKEGVLLLCLEETQAKHVLKECMSMWGGIFSKEYYTQGTKSRLLLAYDF